MTQESVNGNRNASGSKPVVTNDTDGITSKITDDSTAAPSNADGNGVRQDANQSKDDDGTGLAESQEEETTEKKDSKLKVMWKKLGLDVGTFMMMFKYVSRP